MTIGLLLNSFKSCSGVEISTCLPVDDRRILFATGRTNSYLSLATGRSLEDHRDFSKQVSLEIICLHCRIILSKSKADMMEDCGKLFKDSGERKKINASDSRMFVS